MIDNRQCATLIQTKLIWSWSRRSRGRI